MNIGCAENVVGIDDGRWGKTQYQYDANDQIVRAHFGGLLPQEERFSYDGAQNLCSHQRLGAGVYAAWEENTQQQRAGRVVRRGHYRYRYDEAGQLAEKREVREGYRERVWRYRWNTESQLSELMTPEGERWAYRYDALGRRIRKQRLSGGHPGARPAGYNYLWSGDQLTEEVPLYADGTPAYDESVHWLYTPGALTPLARYEKGQLHYVVSDHMGTPRELLTEQGNVAWSGRLNTWGGIKLWQVSANDGDKLRCNLRFAGQYADEESGLHYNRYRYYDSETGQYLSPDPIGLAGGVNPYGYVANPLRWVDPLGLCKTLTSNTDPSELVNNGRVSKADIDAWANQNGILNSWAHDPAKFPGGGFKYDSGSYTVHGHGANPSAAAKFPNSNAASGPTASIKNTSTGEVFRTDGTWGKFKSDPNGAHIPLDDSSY